MRGVLIDDHHAVARLRDDIGLVHLRPRGAERRGDILRARLRMRARIGRRRDIADIEGGLPRLAEPRGRGG